MEQSKLESLPHAQAQIVVIGVVSVPAKTVIFCSISSIEHLEIQIHHTM